jgi:hypothetical protein
MDFALCLDCDARMFDLAPVFLENLFFPATDLFFNKRNALSHDGPASHNSSVIVALCKEQSECL